VEDRTVTADKDQIGSRNGKAPNGWGMMGSEGHEISGRTIVTVMVGVMLGILLAALDQTIVGPALPKIIGDLNGFDQYAWVVTAYLLTSTISVPIFGKLSDIYGRKWFYVGGAVVFLIGSVLAGISRDITQLILFRGLQGLGAGIIFASAFAIVADLIPPRDRGKWQGVFGSVWGLASVIGPTLGGWLTDGPGWRWVFYVNVPVGLVAIAVLVFTFPAGTFHTTKHSVDWLGAVTLILGLSPLLLALSLGGTTNPLTVPFFGTINDLSWGSPTIIGLFVAAIVFLAAFVFIEARSKEAIIPLDLFKNSIFTMSVITVFLTGIGLFGAILFIPLFIQAIQGDSATSSGNAITPMTLAVVVASAISGQIVSRTGRYRWMGIIGMAIATVGMALLYTMDMNTPRLATVAYMVVLGLGMGVTFPLYTLIVQNAFPIQRVGVVTAAVQFFRSIGSTVGVAVLGSVVNSQFHDKLPEELQKQVAQLPPQVASRIPVDQLAGGLSHANPQALVSTEGIQRLHDLLVNQIHVPEQNVGQAVDLIKEAMKPALFTGISEAFLIGTILLGAGLITTAFIKEIALRKTNERGGPGGPGGPDGRVGFEARAEEAGREMAAEGLPGASNIPAEDEPELVGRDR
jgi:EmrB/QacA subfamily drug resistance transporter